MKPGETKRLTVEGEPVDPMVPILTGWLFGCVTNRAGECMKVEEAVVDPPDAFVVKFASGLQLRVRVHEVAPFDAINPWPAATGG